MMVGARAAYCSILRAVVPCGSARNSTSQGCQRVRVDELQIARAAHVRMHGVDVASGVLAAGDLRDLDAGVEGQQAQEFAARVAAAADDAD